ncbi:type 3 dihydrofolate reductase [Marinomonas transparens]|uniref:Dihydrofolate reductase n=1 Tax=Marinomonas transparens TaxID=2795388 RepID=A0A934JV25_9GAMM|nr:type 3 dihydrofolate reductase [Marinomonas transparens]MBJ7538896.1 type 3 dihydrofolate reductase [Marinomonas transparens]
MLSLIVAMSTNRTIGINNALPWHLPNDLKYFKQATMGKPIVMGRKTFESIGKPLPGRRNIVISRDANYQAEGVDVVASLEDAISLGEDICLVDGQEEVMVIGGSQIYQLALEKAQRLYITHVDAEVQGDAVFPEVDWPSFTLIGEEAFAAEGPNPYDYRFSVYQRSSAE